MAKNIADRFYHLTCADNSSDSRGSDQNIDDGDKLPSWHDDDALLRSPDDSDTEPWDQWTGEQKTVMMQHYNYYLDVIGIAHKKIKEINKCWANGPIPKSQVKNVPPMPKTDLAFLYTEKTKKKSTDDDNAFLNYLKSKYYPNDTQEEVNFIEEMPTNDLDEMAKHLRKRYLKLEKNKKTLLNEHFCFGYDLTRAKTAFKFLKRKRHDRSKISWDNWISENTKICKSYANKHIAVCRLVSEYPGLKRLSMSFKELYAISGRIRTVFSKTDTEGRKWQ